MIGDGSSVMYAVPESDVYHAYLNCRDLSILDAFEVSESVALEAEKDPCPTCEKRLRGDKSYQGRRSEAVTGVEE